MGNLEKFDELVGIYGSIAWSKTRTKSRGYPYFSNQTCYENIDDLIFLETPQQETKQCPCLKCIKQRDTELGRIFQSAMQLCPVCGNKRCPKGTNHDLYCSGSNLPGQDGSSYE